MAVFNLWKALGLESKSAPDTPAYTHAVRPFQSLTEIPVGKTLNEQILAALQQGKGIGFSPEYAEKTTSPLVATRQARWGEVERPALESSLASRGLSRSTLGARDIGMAEASKERDINDIMGQAYKEQESQKKLDEARYQGLGQWYTGAESGQRSQYATEDAARMKYASDAENAYRAQKETERIADLNKTIGLGLRMFGPQAAADVFQGTTVTPMGKTTTDDTLKEEEALKRAERAQASPFIGGKKSPIDFQSLYNMFATMGA